MHLGVREHLNFPLDASVLANAIDSARRRLVTHPMAAARQSDLYTFLPAKPGVGTSTIAVSASHALAEDSALARCSWIAVISRPAPSGFC